MSDEQMFNWIQHDLLSIIFDPSNTGCVLRTSNLSKNILISSNEILHFVSCFSIEGYSPTFVVDIALFKLNKIRAFDLMREKGYQWVAPVAFPNYIWHLHVEGGVVIDAFSASEFTILKE